MNFYLKSVPEMNIVRSHMRNCPNTNTPKYLQNASVDIRALLVYQRLI